MTISKEAVEAALDVWFDDGGDTPEWKNWPLAPQYRSCMASAITAALALRPAPSQSDEHGRLSYDELWKIATSYQDRVNELATSIATVRAEATLAGAADEREECADACKGKRTALEAEAAIRSRSL